MKKIFSLILFSFIVISSFATPLIDAAKNQDYKTFEKLVNSGASLEETDELGMNLQIALAYFDEKDFKKACKLLAKKDFDFDIPVENNISLLYVLAYSCSYEKLSVLLNYDVDVNRKNTVTDLTPIDATQFSTFEFYSEQKIDSLAYKRAEETRKLLLKHGSEAFNYAPLTMGNVGNVFFCFINAINVFYPFVTPEMINSGSLFDFHDVNGQEMATLKQDEIIKLFSYLGLDIEITNHYESEEILQKLIETELSEYYFLLIGSTGNNQIGPYQWVSVNGSEFSKNPSLDCSLKVSNPDMLFGFVSYQVKDLSQLIAIKIKNF